MWFQLFLATVLAIAVLALPGYAIARAIASRPLSLCVAPLITIACYGVLGVLYGFAGIPSSVLTLTVPVAVAGAAIAYARRDASSLLDVSDELNAPYGDKGVLAQVTAMRLALVLAIAAGVATSLAVYVANIGDPDAFIQNYDNAFHLNRIHRFADTGNYSTLTDGFYPSAWHIIAALAESTLGCSTALAEHAANLAFIVYAFPAGSALLLATLFPERRRTVWLGGMLCLSFGFFPWRIMLFGPLYPNLSAFSLMPAVAALFILMLKREASRAERAGCIALFVTGGVAMALAQPNAIFSTGAFLIPFCVWRAQRFAFERLEGRSHRLALSVLAAACLALLFALLWFALSQAPFMHGVVYYPRESPLELGKALRWALAYSFVIKRQQYLIALVVALGALLLLVRPRTRWVPFSYALLIAIFVTAISIDGPLKNIVAGFWYSDWYRIAATVCVFAVPLVAVGMDGIAGALMWCGRRACRAAKRPARGPVLGGALAALGVAAIMAVNYVPFWFIEEYYKSYAFDAVSYEMRDMYQNETNISLEPEERAFIEQAMDAMPEDELVLNVPYDGSVFAYATDDLDVAFDAFGRESTPEEELLRQEACDIATDEAVAAAAEDAGIHYVLQLDQGHSEHMFSEDGSIYLLGYVPEEWEGITSITDETPGFEVVLAEGDMRLYRITD